MMTIPESALPHITRHRSNIIGAEHFTQSLANDFAQIRPYLPARVNRILDIGCGVAGIDVFLKRQYPDAELWLLDSDGDEQRAGWNDTMQGYTSRAAAADMLSENGGFVVDRWIDVNTREALSADLVISLASWGYHYPLATYSVAGFCIADLRKVKEPPRGVVITEYHKRNRCAWMSRA